MEEIDISELLDDDEIGPTPTDASSSTCPPSSTAKKSTPSSTVKASSGAAAAAAAAAAANGGDSASKGSFTFARGGGGGAASPAASSASSYKSMHKDTLKLLADISPSQAKVPSAKEIKGALSQLSPVLDRLDDLDEIQSKLEDHLDVSDLSSQRKLIKAAVDAYRKEEEKTVFKASQESLITINASQESISMNGDDGKTEASKKRRRTGEVKKSELPLLFPKNLGRCKSFIVELDERDRRQDLTGDSGAVGRVHVDKKKGLVLDLKGHQYQAHLARCPTLLLVSLGDEEAKVEDVVDTLCLLTHQRDHLKDMGGEFLKGVRGDDVYYDSDDDFAMQNEGDSDGGEKASKGKKGKAGGSGGGGTRTRVTPKGGSRGGRGKGKGKGKGGGVKKSTKAASSSTKKKGASSSAVKKAPKKVSLKKLSKQAKKGGDEEDDEEDVFDDESEDVDDDDSGDSDF